MPSHTVSPGHAKYQLATSIQALAKADPRAAKAKCAFLLRHGQFIGGTYKWYRTGGGDAILYKRCRHCGHVELELHSDAWSTYCKPLSLTAPNKASAPAWVSN